MNPPPSILNHQPSAGTTAFPRALGETPRAFSAFAAFFELGPDRSLQSVADLLGETLGTVKNWSSKYAWSARLNAHAAGLLDQHVRTQAAAVRDQSADWARRNHELREQQWFASQKLLGAAQCFLDSFGDQELQRMNLTQVSRALQIGSRLGHHSLAATPPPDEPSALAPVQTELLAALKKMFPPATDVPDLPGPADTETSPPVPPTP